MIIKSLLDTDFYKFTMQQVILHRFAGTTAKYAFKCRNPGVALTEIADDIRSEIQALGSLTFTIEELNYLKTIRFLKPDYVEFLKNFRLNPAYVKVVENQETGEIDIDIEGPWLQTIMFEIPILSIVNELWFRKQNPYNNTTEGVKRLENKIDLVRSFGDQGFKFADFGTRRRFSRDWQKYVVSELKKNLPENMVGTSNVKLAMDFGLTPIGTMAHEFLQAAQALGPNLRDFQKFAFETWAQEYRGDLGIALSDVVGMDAFLADFDLYFCKLFDGMRHDSGCPFEWGRKFLDHYRKMHIDPKNKTMVFSDGLDFEKAIELYKEFGHQAHVSFGIGTNLTNDVGYTPLNIVIKMVECNGRPVAKVSDSAGKEMCKDATYIAYLKSTFGIK